MVGFAALRTTLDLVIFHLEYFTTRASNFYFRHSNFPSNRITEDILLKENRPVSDFPHAGGIKRGSCRKVHVEVRLKLNRRL
jgi:hypothetical protein